LDPTSALRRLRTDRQHRGVSCDARSSAERILPADIVPFPRGSLSHPTDGWFSFILVLGPTGEGARTIAALSAEHTPLTLRWSMIRILVHSICCSHRARPRRRERASLRSAEAVTTVRQYDASTGRLVSRFRPDDSVQFQPSAGFAFGPGGNLFCVAQDEVVGFDLRLARASVRSCATKPQRHGSGIFLSVVTTRTLQRKDAAIAKSAAIRKPPVRPQWNLIGPARLIA